MLAIGNDELGGPLAATAKCPGCGKRHRVEYGDEIIGGRKVPSKLLAFVKCGEELYLVGISGRRLQ